MVGIMKRRLLYTGVALALGVNLFFGAQVFVQSAEAAGKNDIYRNLRLFSLVLERVRQDYVDGENLTYQDLVYGALKGLLNSLDPHSEFLEPRKYGDFKDDTEGAYGGVGLTIRVSGDYLTVITAFEDGPAFRAGIRSGDQLLRIAGRSAVRMSDSEAVRLLRGAPGTEVQVTVRRPSSDEETEYTLKREVIKIETVRDLEGRREFRLGPDKIGYARVLQFGEQTTGELEEALKKLNDQGMLGLVLDLRDNPGGLLEQAVRVCSLFLPPKTLVVSTEGRDPSERREFRVPVRGRHYEMPVVLLINQGSASASEIVAGCFQDLKRAVVVGDKSFGKGSVQSVIELQDGAAMRLTTAKYYTPSHKVIHERGITPDIEVSLTREEEEALNLRRMPGMLDSPDLVARREEIEAVRDWQLERAVDLLKGITLYQQRNGKLAKASRQPAVPKN
jgi:carboxyl-terminal processing protease